MNPEHLFIDTAALLKQIDSLKKANITLQSKINDVPTRKIILYSAGGASLMFVAMYLHGKYKQRQKLN